MSAEVCSLYLVDRDGAGLTLAATNGVDREHIGVARLDIGQGITGLAASTRGPVVSTDLANDPRCAWIRGVDHERFTSILAVPLEAGDHVVGVLNVKTEARRDFDESEIRRLSMIASLLAGVVERRRLHMETEAQLDGLRSVDQARAELIAVVTHQLRTPLAVVRAYLDLLAETADPARSEDVAGWHEAATGQVLRLNDLVDTILETVRADRLLTVEIRRIRRRRRDRRGADPPGAAAAPPSARALRHRQPDGARRSRRGWPRCSSCCWRMRPSTRRPGPRSWWPTGRQMARCGSRSATTGRACHPTCGSPSSSHSCA